MLGFGLGVIVFLVLSVVTAAFAGVMWALDCHCIEITRLMGIAVMLGGASNLCFFAMALGNSEASESQPTSD